MNLYLFHDTGGAAIYGIGSYIRELTHALEGSAIHLRIVCLRSARGEFEIDKTDTTEIWYIPEIRHTNDSMDAIREMETYHSNVIYLLKLYIKDTENLVFHFNYNHCWLLAKELKVVFNCKTIATIHYTKWQLKFHGNLHKLQRIKAKPEQERNAFEQNMYSIHQVESIMFKAVDRIITLSKHMQHILETEYQLDPDKIVVIPNGLKDNEQLKIDNYHKGNLRKKWNIPPKEKIILFAGRIDEVKGVVFLIKAFHEVLKMVPGCRLILAGSGKYDTYLYEAKDSITKITFTGLLDKKDLYELYQIANIGIVPSLYEPFGYVAVEMMMHRLPIVTTATSGLNEVVDEFCGLKVPVTELTDSVEIDPSLLAQKILYLLQNPVEAKRLGKNARKRYMEKYSSPVFGKNMIELYNSLCLSV